MVTVKTHKSLLNHSKEFDNNAFLAANAGDDDGPAEGGEPRAGGAGLPGV